MPFCAHSRIAFATNSRIALRVTAMRGHVHVRRSVVHAVHMSRCCSGSYFGNSRLCLPRLLLGTLLRCPLAHSRVHFVRCVTGHAAHDSARHGAVTTPIACDTASHCACDAAFSDGDTWGECNREG